ncbi:MAG: flagellar basal body P-ring formation chaperone FlgA [Alphaproteobacteria bacterium]
MNILHISPEKNHSPMAMWGAISLAVVALVAVPLLGWSAEVQVPVLTHAKALGEVVQAEDIALRTMDDKHVNARMVREQVELVGKEATRPLRAGVPLYIGYVRTAPAVRKNAVVALVFQARGMELSGTGKALQDAAAGQNIRVLNMESGKVVAGLVTEHGQVVVK